MATYSKLTGDCCDKHGIRAIKTSDGLELIASMWVKTASGLVKIYEAVRACFAAKRWRYEKPWTYRDKWKY